MLLLSHSPSPPVTSAPHTVPTGKLLDGRAKHSSSDVKQRVWHSCAHDPLSAGLPSPPHVSVHTPLMHWPLTPSASHRVEADLRMDGLIARYHASTPRCRAEMQFRDAGRSIDLAIWLSSYLAI